MCEWLCSRIKSLLQATSRSSTKVISSEVSLWVQTLGDIPRVVISLSKGEQRLEDDTRTAKLEGVMCSALVELVCEALGSSGREPEPALVA